MISVVLTLEVFFVLSCQYHECCSAVHYDTIIIGMGAAGSAAASALAQAGRRVLGLEAQSYVGGRVKTFVLPNGIVELGAEWIHGSQDNLVFNLAKQANLSLLLQERSFKLYYSGGILNNTDSLEKLIYHAFELIRRRPIIPQALGQYLTRGIIEIINEKYPFIQRDKEFLTAFLDMIDLIVDNDKGTDNWNQYSTQSQYEELGGHQQISWHEHGYKTLFEILLNTYNGPGYQNLDILLNKEVIHILWPTNPKWLVIVTCRDGTIYSANNVIVTVSLGVLKERHTMLFTPNLPSEKKNAINRISMGTVGKIIITFDESWWPENCSYIGFIWKTKDRAAVHPNDYWTTRIFGATCPKASRKSITLWTNGEVTKIVEKLPEDTVRTKVMALLTKFMAFNATITEPISILRSSWYSNPFTRGTYSYDNLLTSVYPTARYDLATPLLDSAGRSRVLFAGEATSMKHFSTVHGAIESGYTEANRILNATIFQPLRGRVHP